MTIDRRNFLKLSAAGAAVSTLAPLLNCPFLRRPLDAAMLGSPEKKMILVFLRGGVDSANMVIPHGDGSYDDVARPTLFIPEADAIDLGNSFASAHPALSNLIDNVPTGDVAYLHRVAYANQSRSHFSSQQYWENATPGDPFSEIGWVNRMIDNSDFGDLALPAASISNRLQVLFRGPLPLAHIQDLERYKFGDDDVEAKFLGAAPTVTSDGAGMLGVFGAADADGPYDGRLRALGRTLATSLEEVAPLDSAGYVPEGGATYPSAAAPGEFVGDQQAYQFFQQLKEAVILLKETDCRVVGIELDGFDTHANQIGILDRLLRIVSHGIASVYADTSVGTGTTLWDDLVMCTLSEFGRTSAENGSFGTDHGEAGCMIVAGGGVVGGVYNCDATTWEEGDLFSAPSGVPRYVAHRTDYRAVLAEIIDRHFGQSTILADAIPDWDLLTGDAFDYLEFLEL